MKLGCPLDCCNPHRPLRSVTHLLAHRVGAHGKTAEGSFSLVLGPLDAEQDRLDGKHSQRTAPALVAAPTADPPPLPPESGLYWRCVSCGTKSSGPFTSAFHLKQWVERHVRKNPRHVAVVEERRP